MMFDPRLTCVRRAAISALVALVGCAIESTRAHPVRPSDDTALPLPIVDAVSPAPAPIEQRPPVRQPTPVAFPTLRSVPWGTALAMAIVPSARSRTTA